MNRIRQAVALIATGVVFSGCASQKPISPLDSATPADYEAVSKNLVDVIVQYPQFDQGTARLGKSASGTAFGQQVYQEFSERGYELADPGSETISSVIDAEVRRAPYESGENAPLYVLSVGDVSVERRFRVDSDATLPVSEVVVRGAEQRDITLNDDTVFEQADPILSDVRFSSPLSETELLNEPEIGAATSVASQDVSRAGADETMPGIQRNIYETLESNYKDALVDYEDIEQKILVFPNDSLRLGDANKQVIEYYVDLMDPETDVLSVIGCSHGVTDIANGNAVLALGRAHRVKEAFMFSGIHHDQVLDEGCWASEHFREMPARGVLLTLKRRKDA